MLKLEKQPHLAYQDYQQTPILNRQDAKKYQLLLETSNPLFHEIARILATHQNGIHSLSSGQKINATQFQLLGGGKVENAISVTISHKQERKVYYYQAPPGKYIVRYESRSIGQQKDLEKIGSSLYYLAPNSTITKRDMENWERSGKAGVDVNIAHVAPLNIGANGQLTAKNENVHEESYSNQTVVLELTAREHFYQSMDPVTINVDVYLEDVPEKKEVLSLQNKAGIEDCEAGGSIKATTTEGMVLKQDAERTTLNEATVKKSKAAGNILASGGMAQVVTEEQMEQSVDINSLNAQIDKISAEIDKLKLEENEIEKKYESAQNENMKKRYETKLDEVDKERNILTKRKNELQEQISDILKNRGKEPEKK